MDVLTACMSVYYMHACLATLGTEENFCSSGTEVRDGYELAGKTPGLQKKNMCSLIAEPSL